MSRFGLGFVSGNGGNDLFTKSLLHFDGANGSTTITDTAFGQTPVLTWTAVGSALSTASSKFGTASLAVTSPQYVTTPNNAVFNSLGTTPFVFDFQANASSFGSARAVAGIGFQGTTYSFTVVRDAANTFSFIVPGSTVTTTGSVAASGYHHIACIADGSKIYIALDGAVSAGVSYSSLPATTGPFDIGDFHVTAGSVSTGFAGNIDEARLSIGTTRGWTSNFTPPSAAYS